MRTFSWYQDLDMTLVPIRRQVVLYKATVSQMVLQTATITAFL